MQHTGFFFFSVHDHAFVFCTDSILFMIVQKLVSDATCVGQQQTDWSITQTDRCIHTLSRMQLVLPPPGWRVLDVRRASWCPHAPTILFGVCYMIWRLSCRQDPMSHPLHGTFKEFHPHSCSLTSDLKQVPQTPEH